MIGALAGSEPNFRSRRLLVGLPPRHRITVTAVQLTDAIGLGLAFLVATYVVPFRLEAMSIEEFLSIRLKLVNVVLLFGLLWSWRVALRIFGLYDPRRAAFSPRRVVEVAEATALCAALALVFSIPFDISLVTPTFLVVFWSSGTALLVVSRLLLQLGLEQLGRGVAFERRILIVGTGSAALQFADDLARNPEPGCQVIGFADDNWSGIVGFHQSGRRVSCDLKNLASFIRDQVVDEVVIALPLSVVQTRQEEILGVCETHGVAVRFLAGVFGDLGVSALHGVGAQDAVLLTVFNGGIDGWPWVAKRALDLGVSALLLIALAPLFAITALAVAVSSPGPVVFTQERVGLNKRRFRMYKFRTMNPDAEERISELEHLNEAGGPVFKLKDDPRITRIGRFLRRSSLDELPQIVNVLLGDMSLVGPRPLPLRDFEGFDSDRYRRRFSVRPGLSGLWQVSGRSSIGFEEWMELDLRYIDEWSLGLDLKILALTAPAVLNRKGAT